jgi:hypothetical protein
VKGLAVASAVAVLAVSGVAQAQGMDQFGAYGPAERGRYAESKQTAAFEIRFGRYNPSVDDEFNASPGPYREMFGTDPRYSIGIEGDWQVLRIPHVGTLGPGFGASYTKSTAGSFLTRDLLIGGFTRPGEKNSLIIFPLYAVGVLRVDVLAREMRIPFVPYAKLGLGLGLWRVSNGGGTAKVDGVSGSGLSYGPQFALGGMLLLDFLEPTAAKEMDNNVGINHSYFFAEWYVSKLNGFGSGSQMNVGTNTWVLGLAFEI